MGGTGEGSGQLGLDLERGHSPFSKGEAVPPSELQPLPDTALRGHIPDWGSRNVADTLSCPTSPCTGHPLGCLSQRQDGWGARSGHGEAPRGPWD